MTQNTLTIGIIDYLAATSVELVKLLAEHFWRVKPRYTTEPQDIEQMLRRSASALLIGDDALVESAMRPRWPAHLLPPGPT